ncbi:MAG: bifunctional glycosyltransferase family 2/GtrA family protein [Oscillospiraceae bacterium]|nr:bifunctional glycosyltransferase family 2/GtrA family protein [Oscillospiraceae bacterium]
MNDLSKISVVLPSLDPDEKLTAVIDGLLEYGFSHIILVNDGSKPENLHYFEEAAAAHPEITLLRHEVNRGKGAALKTAFTWFLKNRPEGLGVVTVDGDNQHHPADTRACVENLLKTGHLTLGVRDFSQPDVPPRSRFGNKTTSLVFKIFVGMTISDTQTGLRAIGREDLELLTTVAGDRFEYETNMLLALKTNAIPFDEVKIRTVYIEENASSHFHPIRDSWRIYKLILAHFFRYTLSAIISAVVDTGAYGLLSKVLTGLLEGFALTAVAGVGARVISSILNFFLNKQMVFRSSEPTGAAMLRYYALAVPQMCVQVLLTQGVYTLLHIGDDQTFLRTVLYVAVMCVLYVVSFMIQQRWVFASRKKREKEHVK